MRSQIAKIPVKNEDIIPTPATVKLNSFNPFSIISIICSSVAPAMAGIASKKEKRAASSPETPRSIPTPIVEPALDIPGMIANA